MASNEVTIIVRAKNETKAALEQTRADMARGGDEAGKAFGEKLTKGVDERLRDARGRFVKLGDDLGGTLGDGITRSLDGRLRDARGRFVSGGRHVGEGLGEGLKRSLPQVLSGAIGNAFNTLNGGDLKTAGLAGLTVALSPLIGSAISAAVPLALGGGVLAGGIALAAGNSQVKSAFGKLGEQILGSTDTKKIEDRLKAAQDRLTKAQSMGSASGVKSAQYDIAKAQEDLAKATEKNAGSLKGMADVFVGPLTRAAKTFGAALESIKPDIQDLFNTMAPVVDTLAPAFADMIKNMMPGIKDAVKASVPLFEKLAEYMPVIGDAIGDFFSKISANSEETTQFFGDLLDAIVMLIDFFGSVIVFTAKMYSGFRKAFVGSAEAVAHFIDKARSLFASLSSRASSVFSSIGSHARSAFNTAAGAVSGFLSRARSVFSSVVSAIGSAMTSAYNRVVSFVNRAISIIRSIPGRVGNLAVNVFPRVIGGAASAVRSALGFAHGGIVGAANGATSSGMTWVGEQGPELLDLPPGTRVHSAGDSRRMAKQGGQGRNAAPTIVISPGLAGDQPLIRAILNSLRFEIAGQGGNVQTVLGRG